jgi:hypothetical protein
MTLFEHLHTLALTGNRLNELRGLHLPRSLRVLQLAACNLSTLEGLMDCPPALHHLGLAHNEVYDPCSTVPTRLPPLILRHSPAHAATAQLPCPPSFERSPALLASLLSLDIAFNELADLETTLQASCCQPDPEVLCASRPIRVPQTLVKFNMSPIKSSCHCRALGV